MSRPLSFPLRGPFPATIPLTMATSAATPPEPTRDECSYASVSHFLQMGTAFIGPLVIFAIKRESRFVKFHALQAVLLQIIFFVAMMISMVLWMGVMFGTVLAHQQQGTQANQAPPLVPSLSSRSSGLLGWAAGSRCWSSPSFTASRPTAASGRITHSWETWPVACCTCDVRAGRAATSPAPPQSRAAAPGRAASPTPGSPPAPSVPWPHTRWRAPAPLRSHRSVPGCRAPGGA